MKRTLLLLLTTAILAGLCACGESTDTDVTNPIDRPTIQDQPEATNPAVIVDPAGVYRLTGLSTEGPDAYQEMDFGELCVYEDNSGDIYFDDYYHDFTWAMEGNQFIATTTDDPSVTIQGALNDGVMELKYEENIYLRFQHKTPAELEQETVDYLRNCMIDTAERMAVAYLGWYEGDEMLGAWLTRTCPNMLAQYPFIANIPQERIVGDRGEVYILVPKEYDARLNIYLLPEKTDGDKGTLYEGQTGEPVLLMCNYAGSYPSTYVAVTDDKAEDLIFYPQLGDMGAVVVPTNDGLEDLMFDFSDYFEVTQDYYQGMLANDWQLTDEAYLTSTCWNYYEDTVEERCWVLNLQEDGMVQLDLTVDGVAADHYEGSWGLNWSDNDGLTWMYLNLGDAFEGECVVLQCPYDVGILLGIKEDLGNLPVPCDENATFWWGSVG